MIRRSMYHDSIRLDYPQSINLNTRALEHWNKLVKEETDEKKLSVLKREKKYFEQQILTDREYIFNDAVLLFKCKETFDLTTTKDFNKFSRSIFNPYKYKVAENSRNDQIIFHHYGEYKKDNDFLNSLIEKGILTINEETKEIFEGISGMKIKKNTAPRQYENTGFVLWTIYSGDSLNTTVKKEYLTYQTRARSNIDFDSTKQDYVHPQDVLVEELNKVKSSQFVRQTLGEYFTLIDERIEDKLNQRGKDIDMFDTIEKHKAEREGEQNEGGNASK